MTTRHLIQLILLPLSSLLFACAAAPEVAVSTEGLTATNGFFRQGIDVPTVEGVVHTEVVFRASALLRRDPRVVVMIPGTLANGAAYFDIAPGTGFDAAEVLASQHYVVVLVDLPGSGQSFRPADGRDADIPMAARAVRRVSVLYRAALHAHGGVDLYGETGVGTNVGLLLAREPWVRSFSASAVFYLQFGPAAGQLFDPGYYAFLDSLPTGYLPQDPAFIGLLLWRRRSYHPGARRERLRGSRADGDRYRRALRGPRCGFRPARPLPARESDRRRRAGDGASALRSRLPGFHRQ